MKLTVAILGAGESGVGAALLAKSKGYDVFLSDRGKIAAKYCQILNDHEIVFEEGNHTLGKLAEANLVIKSPGIPGHVSILQELRKFGIPIISEIEFASRYTNAKIIAITGTNGKTTTTLLTYHLLKESGFNVGVGGNLGNSFAAMVVDDPYDFYVLEISSFQLDDVEDFQPDIAVLLNVTPDHLDRYENDMRKYMLSKFRITMNQKKDDLFIYGGDSRLVKEQVARLKNDVTLIETSVVEHDSIGGWIGNEALEYRLSDEKRSAIAFDSLPLVGKHNQLNALTATLVAFNLGIPQEEIERNLKTFKNAPHRMELVDKINGVSFINDSKATNTDAVYYALEGIDQDIVWIAGGVDKGNEYEQIALLVEKKVSHLICLGTDNRVLAGFFSNLVTSIVEVSSMKEAVKHASEKAETGTAVLLSPACASFDLFKNYIDRGDQFRSEVKKLNMANKNKEAK